MPRGNRHYIPGCVWHITHRCHKKEFLLKLARARIGKGTFVPGVLDGKVGIYVVDKVELLLRKSGDRFK
jgi:hypothetical protein